MKILFGDMKTNNTMNKIIQKSFGVIILICSLKNLKDSLTQVEMQSVESI
jgi:hypothetical protein